MKQKEKMEENKYHNFGQFRSVSACECKRREQEGVAYLKKLGRYPRDKHGFEHGIRPEALARTRGCSDKRHAIASHGNRVRRPAASLLACERIQRRRRRRRRQGQARLVIASTLPLLLTPSFDKSPVTLPRVATTHKRTRPRRRERHWR